MVNKVSLAIHNSPNPVIIFTINKVKKHVLGTTGKVTKIECICKMFYVVSPANICLVVFRQIEAVGYGYVGISSLTQNLGDFPLISKSTSGILTLLQHCLSASTKTGLI